MGRFPTLASRDYFLRAPIFSIFFVAWKLKAWAFEIRRILGKKNILEAPGPIEGFFHGQKGQQNDAKNSQKVETTSQIALQGRVLVLGWKFLQHFERTGPENKLGCKFVANILFLAQFRSVAVGCKNSDFLVSLAHVCDLHPTSGFLHPTAIDRNWGSGPVRSKCCKNCYPSTKTRPCRAIWDLFSKFVPFLGSFFPFVAHFGHAKKSSIGPGASGFYFVRFVFQISLSQTFGLKKIKNDKISARSP